MSDKYSEDEESVAEAIYSIARAIKQLGVGNASTDMGAIEVLALKIGEAGEAIKQGLEDIAEAVRGRE